MELITRRRFGQIAIASGAAVVVGGLISKTVAQTPGGVVILGATSGKVSANASQTTDFDDVSESEEQEESVVEEDSNPKKPIIIKSFNVSNGKTKTVTKTKPILEKGELISGLAVSSKGVLVVATTTVAGEGNTSNRLISIKDNSVEIKEVSGVAKDDSLDLIELPDGSIAGVVKKENGTGSRKVVDVEPESGVVKKKTAPIRVLKQKSLEKQDSSKTLDKQSKSQVLLAQKEDTVEVSSQLPSDKEYQSPVICDDGNRYAFLTDFKGKTSLVNITTGKTTPVTFEGAVWKNGFSSLVCADNNELYALGGRRYETPKFMHLVDKETGNLKRLGPFDVATITIAR